MSRQKQEYEPLKRTRTSLKSWVTRYCNNAHHTKDDGTLTKEILQAIECSVKETIKKLEENEYKIDEVYLKYDLIEETSPSILLDIPARDPEAKVTLDFIIGARKMIADLYFDIEGLDDPAPHQGASDATLQSVLAAVSNKAVSRVNLDCKVYNSDKATNLKIGMSSTRLLCYLGQNVKIN